MTFQSSIAGNRRLHSRILQRLLGVILCVWLLFPLYGENSTAVLGILDPRCEKGMDFLEEVQRDSGVDPLIMAWQTDFSQAFPTEACQRIWSSQRIPLLIWDPVFSISKKTGRPSTIKLKDIVDGEYDPYLISWAGDAAAYDKPVLIQFLREFNLSTPSWGIESNQKNPILIRMAFRKVIDVFRSCKARNVKWVWGPSVFPSTPAAWNDWDEAYPGDSYVDFIGLTGLDYAETRPGWLPYLFDQLFEQPVRRARVLAEDKPILITKVSTLRTGTERQAWIRNLASSLLGQLSNLRGVIWYGQGQAWKVQEGDGEEFGILPRQKISEDLRDSFLARPFWGLRILPFKKEVEFNPQVHKIPWIQETDILKLTHALRQAPLIYLDFPFASVVGRGMGEGEKFSARVRLAWNQTGLLVWGEIMDSSPGEGRQRPEEIWDGDHLELDVGKSPYSDRPSPFRDSYRLLVSPGGPDQIIPSYALFRGSDGGLETHIQGIKFQSQFGVGGDSYRLFGIVPWKSLGMIPAEGKVIPFTMAVTDGFKGHRIRQLIWTGSVHYYHDSSEWGQLVLNAQ